MDRDQIAAVNTKVSEAKNSRSKASSWAQEEQARQTAELDAAIIANDAEELLSTLYGLWPWDEAPNRAAELEPQKYTIIKELLTELKLMDSSDSYMSLASKLDMLSALGVSWPELGLIRNGMDEEDRRRSAQGMWESSLNTNDPLDSHKVYNMISQGLIEEVVSMLDHRNYKYGDDPSIDRVFDQKINLVQKWMERMLDLSVADGAYAWKMIKDMDLPWDSVDSWWDDHKTDIIKPLLGLVNKGWWDRVIETIDHVLIGELHLQWPELAIIRKSADAEWEREQAQWTDLDELDESGRLYDFARSEIQALVQDTVREMRQPRTSMALRGMLHRMVNNYNLRPEEMRQFIAPIMDDIAAFTAANLSGRAVSIGLGDVGTMARNHVLTPQIRAVVDEHKPEIMRVMLGKIKEHSPAHAMEYVERLIDAGIKWPELGIIRQADGSYHREQQQRSQAEYREQQRRQRGDLDEDDENDDDDEGPIVRMLSPDQQIVDRMYRRMREGSWMALQDAISELEERRTPDHMIEELLSPQAGSIVRWLDSNIREGSHNARMLEQAWKLLEMGARWPSLVQLFNKHKALIVRGMLTQIKAADSMDLEDLEGHLRQLSELGMTWPEMAVISNSVNAELDRIYSIDESGDMLGYRISKGDIIDGMRDSLRAGHNGAWSNNYAHMRPFWKPDFTVRKLTGIKPDIVAWVNKYLSSDMRGQWRYGKKAVLDLDDLGVDWPELWRVVDGHKAAWLRNWLAQLKELIGSSHGEEIEDLGSNISYWRDLLAKHSIKWPEIDTILSSIRAATNAKGNLDEGQLGDMQGMLRRRHVNAVDYMKNLKLKPGQTLLQRITPIKADIVDWVDHQLAQDLRSQQKAKRTVMTLSNMGADWPELWTVVNRRRSAWIKPWLEMIKEAEDDDWESHGMLQDEIHNCRYMLAKHGIKWPEIAIIEKHIQSIADRGIAGGQDQLDESKPTKGVDLRKYVSTYGRGLVFLKIPVDQIWHTSGKGYWSDVGAKPVKIISIKQDIELGSDGWISDLGVEFDTSTWNVKSDGLIYTDPQFLAQLHKFLMGLGVPRDIVRQIKYRYSKPGLQDEDYVSFDANAFGEYVADQFVIGDAATMDARKTEIIRAILLYIKDSDFNRAAGIFNQLRQLGAKWPELDAIEKSLRAGTQLGEANIEDPVIKQIRKLLGDAQLHSAFDLIRRHAMRASKHPELIEILWDNKDDIIRAVKYNLRDKSYGAAYDKIANLLQTGINWPELREMADAVPKEDVIRHMLMKMKQDNMFGMDDAEYTIRNAKRLGYDWPELDIIHKSLNSRKPVTESALAKAAVEEAKQMLWRELPGGNWWIIGRALDKMIYAMVPRNEIFEVLDEYKQDILTQQNQLTQGENSEVLAGVGNLRMLREIGAGWPEIDQLLAQNKRYIMRAALTEIKHYNTEDYGDELPHIYKNLKKLKVAWPEMAVIADGIDSIQQLGEAAGPKMIATGAGKIKNPAHGSDAKYEGSPDAYDFGPQKANYDALKALLARNGKRLTYLAVERSSEGPDTLVATGPGVVWFKKTQWGGGGNWVWINGVKSNLSTVLKLSPAAQDALFTAPQSQAIKATKGKPLAYVKALVADGVTGQQLRSEVDSVADQIVGDLARTLSYNADKLSVYRRFISRLEHDSGTKLSSLDPQLVIDKAMPMLMQHLIGHLRWDSNRFENLLKSYNDNGIKIWPNDIKAEILKQWSEIQQQLHDVDNIMDGRSMTIGRRLRGFGIDSPEIDEKNLQQQLQDNKAKIIKNLLSRFRDGHISLVKPKIDRLKQFGVTWPELDVMLKSINAQQLGEDQKVNAEKSKVLAELTADVDLLKKISVRLDYYRELLDRLDQLRQSGHDWPELKQFEKTIRRQMKSRYAKIQQELASAHPHAVTDAYVDVEDLLGKAAAKDWLYDNRQAIAHALDRNLAHDGYLRATDILLKNLAGWGAKWPEILLVFAKNKAHLIRDMLENIKQGNANPDDTKLLQARVALFKEFVPDWPELDIINKSLAANTKQISEDWHDVDTEDHDEVYGRVGSSLQDIENGLRTHMEEWHAEMVVNGLADLAMLLDGHDWLDTPTPSEYSLDLVKQKPLFVKALLIGLKDSDPDNVLDAIRMLEDYWHVDWPELAVMRKSMLAGKVLESAPSHDEEAYRYAEDMAANLPEVAADPVDAMHVFLHAADHPEVIGPWAAQYFAPHKDLWIRFLLAEMKGDDYATDEIYEAVSMLKRMRLPWPELDVIAGSIGADFRG